MGCHSMAVERRMLVVQLKNEVDDKVVRTLSMQEGFVVLRFRHRALDTCLCMNSFLL